MNAKLLFRLAAVSIVVGADALAQNTALAPAPVLGTISDFNAVGDVSGKALLGASVRNAAKEIVGKVEEVYVSKNGEIKSVVLSIGGFLGLGARHVLVAWPDLQLQRDNNSLVMTMNVTKEQLKAMPEYTFERRPLQN